MPRINATIMHNYCTERVLSLKRWMIKMMMRMTNLLDMKQMKGSRKEEKMAHWTLHPAAPVCSSA